MTTYPDLFPKDQGYRAAARKLRCPVCDLCKGARKYKQSKRMKQKRESKMKERCAQHATSILRNEAETEAPTVIATEGAAKVCSAHREHRRVRFDATTHTRSRLHEDDFLRAFQPAEEMKKGRYREYVKRANTRYTLTTLTLYR